jgi:endonuclease III
MGSLRFTLRRCPVPKPRNIVLQDTNFMATRTKAKKIGKKIPIKRAPSRPASKKNSAAAPTGKTGALRNPLAPERIQAILKALDEAYPDAVCALTHRTPWELLVATILSAQCTDVRVNMVTPELFRRFPTPQAMAKASLPELEELIRTTGFFRNKAKSIQGAAKKITEQFGGKVPETLAELITVPGAARKTANVVLGVSYGKAEGVVVDTHVFRISRRLDLTKSDTAEKVEQDLMRILPQDRWISFSHQVIHHGRQVCIARGPKCKDCNLETLCKSTDKTWWS